MVRGALGRRDAGLPTGGVSALVDILLATIGIFVIVFALQEIVERDPLHPQDYAALVLCDGTGTLTLALPDRTLPVPQADALAPMLAREVPDGGPVFFGIALACQTRTARPGVSIAQALREQRDQLVDLVSAGPIHVFEVGPLSGDAEAATSFAVRWREEGGADGS